MESDLSCLLTAHKLLLLLLLLSMLLPFLLAAPAVSAEPASPGKPRSTCQSPECVKLAADMSTKLNPAVDPCEDFYSYACGNFANTLPSSQQNLTGNGSYRFVEEDVVGLMQKRVNMKAYKLLLMQSNVTDSDPDIQHLYNLTRLFFHSCGEWIHMSESNEFNGDHLSVGFFRALFNQFVGLEMGIGGDKAKGPAGDGHRRDEDVSQSRVRGDGRKVNRLQLEWILAAMVRSGGGSLVSVGLPDSFAINALLKGFNLSDVVRATVKLFDRRWQDPNIEKFVTFFTTNRIASDLSLDNVSSRFSEVISGLDAYNKSLNASNCQLSSNAGIYTVAQLDQLSRCMDSQNPFSWKLFFERLLRSSVDTEEQLQVSNPLELISVTSFYKRQPVFSETDFTKFSSHVSYLIFDWLLSFGDFFPGSLRQAWRTNASLPYGTTAVWRYAWSPEEACVIWTASFMQPIIERMYRVAYHPLGFCKVLELIQLFKEASISSIRSQDWIEDKTKEIMADKIRHMSHSIGLNDLTNKQLKDYYSEALNSFRALSISMDHLEKSFGSLLSIVLRANAHRKFDIMSGGRNVTIFIDRNPLVVNAFNFGRNNRIVFPMAQLEPPAYHHSFPDYINLGGIGYIIGHEMGHAFDNNAYHQRGDWSSRLWDPRSVERYQGRAECLRGAYGSSGLGKDGRQYKSNATLAEDISDILGLKAAFDALQILKQSQGSMPWLPNLHTELNQDQLFFVHMAQTRCTTIDKNATAESHYSQEHLPNHLRVRGMMQHSWEFAGTFKCRPGQPMNPRRKCTFW